MNRLTFFLLFFVSVTDTFAQVSDDSLTVLMNYRITDRSSHSHYDKLFHGINHSNPAQGKRMIPVYKKAASELEDPIYDLSYYKNAGWNYHLRNIKDSAEIYMNKALELALEQGEENYIAHIYGDLGTAAMFYSNYPKALTYYQEGLNHIDTVTDKETYANSLSKTGHLYRKLKEYDQALVHLNRAIAIKRAADIKSGQASILNEIANVHYMLGDYDKVLQMDHELADFNRETGDVRALAFNLNNLGEDYNVLEEYAKAVEYFKESIALKKTIDNESYLISGYLNMTQALSGLNKHSEASKYLDSAFQVVKKGTLENKADYYRFAYELERGTGNFEKALDLHEDYITYRDSVFSRDNANKITELETRFETVQKEREIALHKADLEQKNLEISRQETWRNALVIVVLLIAVFSFVIFRKNTLIKKQNEKVLADRETISLQNKKLEELDQFKSRFFANISHDLRTPISLIHGYFTEIREDKDSYLTVRSENATKRGLKNVERLIHLTEEINDLIVMEEGSMKLHYKKVKISSYMALLTGLFRSQAESKDLGFHFHSTVDPELEIAVDPDQFEKIIYNLISNAIKFTSRGEIRIQMDMDGSNVQLVFSDTGKGISSKNIQSVFERFYQSVDDTYFTQQGMGIGLFLVKEITELHQGTITAKSELGVGSKFTLTLPVRAELEVENYDPVNSDYIARRSHSADPLPKGLIQLTDLNKSKATVLVTDDHPEVRDYIANQLKDSYNVLLATNGLEALELLGKMKVDLLISDLMMPLMDGFELLKNVNEKYPKLSVMVVSARASVQDTKEILGYGVNDFISKPFDKTDFQLRVKNLIANKASQDFPLFEKDHLKLANNKALDQINHLIRSEISNSRLGILELADVLCLSERQTNRVLKSLTGKSPGEYIKEYKLLYAENLLKSNQITTATELARMIGFNNVTHFNTAFQKRFGYKPEEVIT